MSQAGRRSSKWPLAATSLECLSKPLAVPTGEMPFVQASPTPNSCVRVGQGKHMALIARSKVEPEVPKVIRAALVR